MGKITVRDMDAANALWMLMKQQKREVREILAARLEEALKNEEPSEADESVAAGEPEKAEESPKPAESPKWRYQPSKEAIEFVSSLSVHGEEEVPPDERGIFALIDEKY